MSHNWPTEDCTFNLSVLLTGKTYYRLPVEQASQYDVVKEALLQRYQLTEAGFRSFNSKAEITENAVEFLSRIDGCLTQWMQLAKVEETYEGLRDFLLKKQLLKTCDKNLAFFSQKECQPQRNRQQRYLISISKCMVELGQEPGMS